MLTLGGPSGRSEQLGGVIGGLAASAMDRRARRAGWPRARRRRARSRGDRLALDTGRRRLDPDCGRRDVRRLRPVGNVPRPRPGCCRQIVRRLTVTPRRDGGSDASRRPCPQFEHARASWNATEHRHPPHDRPAAAFSERFGNDEPGTAERSGSPRATDRANRPTRDRTGSGPGEPGPAANRHDRRLD